ncbi:MAG: hypothetical protein KDA17_07500 [Candidatus Saccharibacteria bacterium]|nr:hypothetical protein [Candidatus Saccharibacteria bacterium]
MLALIGGLAVAFKVWGDVGLVSGTWKREIVLHKFTWIIFSLTAWVFLRSQLDLGMSWGKLFFIWIFVVNLVLLALSYTRGRGTGGADGWERAALLVALISLGLLFTSLSPLWALLCTVTADILGAVMSVVKTWHDPTTEIPQPWMRGAIGSFFSLIAVGSLNFELMIGPAYFLLFDGLMWWLAARKPRPSSLMPVPTES